MEFYGIYTPIITPFNDDFSVDEAAYAGMIGKADCRWCSRHHHCRHNR